MNLSRRDFFKAIAVSITGAVLSRISPTTLDSLTNGKRGEKVDLSEWHHACGIFYNAGAVAGWNVALTDAEIAELASGASPLSIRPNNITFYRTSSEDHISVE